MSSLERPLDADSLVLDFAHEQAQMHALVPDRHGRTARTLLKSGALRLTMITLAPGGSLPEHTAAGPITVQPIAGTMRFTVGEVVHDLGPGALVTVASRVRHAVSTEEGVTFLLTLAMPEGGTAAS